MNDKNCDGKTFCGLPMSWDIHRPLANLWNKETDKIILPKKFGIGWTINFHALLRQLGLIPT